MNQKYINFAMDGANRMNSLINDLLGYAEMGGAKEEAFERVDMKDFFDETLLIKATFIDKKWLWYPKPIYLLFGHIKQQCV